MSALTTILLTLLLQGGGEARPTPDAVQAACALHEKGELDAADAAFAAAGSDQGTLRRIARYLCMVQRDFERGEPYARRCHAGAEEAADSVPWLNTLLLTGRTLELEKVSRETLEKYPGSEDVLFHLGLSLLRQQKALEALAIFTELTERFPKVTAYRYGLGDVLFTLRREKDAVVEFRRVLAAEPSNWGAALRLGEALGFLGEDEEAEEVIRDALEKGNRDAALLYGKFLFQRDRFEEALYYFKRWTAEYPEQALAWSYLGRCQLQLGHPKAARKALDRFRELQKRNVEQENEELLRILRMRAEASREKQEGDGGS